MKGVLFDIRNGGHFVVCVCAKTGQGQTQLRFERSSDLLPHLLAQADNDDIDVQWFAVLQTPSRARQGSLERDLSQHFQARKTDGDWLAIDPSNPADGAAFIDGSSHCFKKNGMPGAAWSRITLAQLGTYVEQSKVTL